MLGTKIGVKDLVFIFNEKCFADNINPGIN